MRHQFFIYSAFFINNGINPRTQETIIDNDCAFEVHGITTYFDAYANGVNTSFQQTESAYQIPPITVTVLNTSSGRLLSNAPVALSLFGGSGERPFWLQFPVYWKQGAHILTTVIADALAGPQAINFRLNFIGTKIYGH